MSEFKKMRAAGYARVSTEEEIQEGSYDLQVQYFRDMIMEDPNLELVGVYGDFGITGRDAGKRPGLQQMLKDCDDGKIEVIYTKSVSRFARNIADTGRFFMLCILDYASFFFYYTTEYVILSAEGSEQMCVLWLKPMRSSGK